MTNTEASCRCYGIHARALTTRQLVKPPRPRGGVNPVRVWELYRLEALLPQELRDFARTHQARVVKRREEPPAYYARLDHAFPEQDLNRVVSIDLGERDDVLIAVAVSDRHALNSPSPPDCSHCNTAGPLIPMTGIEGAADLASA